MLEGMKEKSTAAIIEKYNKSVEAVEELTAERMRLVQDGQTLTSQVKAQDEKMKKDREEFRREIEKLKY